MKRTIPLTLVLVLGIIFMIQYFIPSKASQQLFDHTLQWEIVIGIPAILIAIDSLVRHHIIRIGRRQKGWGYSLVYLGAAAFMALAGFIGGTAEGSFYMKLFSYCLAPMQSTMFAILAFYMASAAYRSFRARKAEATVLLLSAFVLMLGLIPLGASLWKGLPVVGEWLMLVPNMASKRAIMFGVGIGIAATNLKIMLGIERNWLGGG